MTDVFNRQIETCSDTAVSEVSEGACPCPKIGVGTGDCYLSSGPEGFCQIFLALIAKNGNWISNEKRSEF